MEENLIKLGDYVIVQRQDYYKLEKVNKRTVVIIGNRKKVDLSSILGKSFYSHFRIIPNVSPEYPNAPPFTLEEADEVKTVHELPIEESGFDNRSITDDGQSQTLTKEEIEKLRDTESAVDLVGTLINNSKTFASKTKYCQSKYLKKKEKKYFEYVQIRKPSIRLLAEMSQNWGPKANMGLKAEHLASILTAANIHSSGTYILHDSGTKGILTAAVMDRIGESTSGSLIYLHPGNQSQRKAFDAMHFPEEQAERCLEVNLYSVLRCFHQCSNGITVKTEDKEDTKVNLVEDRVDMKQEQDEKIQSPTEITENKEVTEEDNKVNLEEGRTGVKRKAEEEIQSPNEKKQAWQLENEKVRRILQERKVDSLILATRAYPDNLIDELFPFIKLGGVLVIFSQYSQVLTDVYTYLKKRTDVINIRVTSIDKTNVQVIEDVTHPEINKTYGGYILSAHKISV